MLIAIDHGNYAVKTPSFSFVSGLSEHTVKPPLTDEIIEYIQYAREKGCSLQGTLDPEVLHLCVIDKEV